MSDTPNTTTKRIQLKVESATPQLSGIDSAIERLAELNKQLVAAGALAGRLSANLGGVFAGFGNSAQSAANQTSKAMGQALAATERTSRAISEMAKMPPVPGLGRLYSVNRSFASEGNFRAGDPQYRQEIFKSRGRTVRRSTVDNENFQYQESVNIDKFWNDAVKQGDKQRARDAKAQRLWREHNNKWAEIRAEKDVQQEVLSGGRISNRGGNSQTAINAQADAAMRDVKLNERSQEQQLARDAQAQRLWREHNRKWKDIRTDARHDRSDRNDSFEQRLQAIRNRGAGVQDKIDNAYRAQARESGGGKSKGGFGFSAGMGFIDKIGTAATWYAAYTAIHKVADVAVYSYQRMEQLELQTARLSQVFRGVGGNANQLSDDVLKLAASEGRSTDEAMASAIAWSRLGLSRREANEAVRVSLVAANVAEISAGQATQSLTSIMAGFNLQVTDLAPALGILNQQSNTYRVTVAELLQGLSRVSGIAQQAGLSLAQLTGILTVSVQKTGQTGANMANALKTTLVRLNRDDVHEFFQKRYGLNTTGSADDLEKIWEVYSKVNKEQQRDILLKVGSATQANRVRAIFETYSESVFAAVDSLKHLNSAEEENLKITNTIAAAKSRLTATWDRLINNTTSGPVAGGVMNILNGGAGAIAGLTGGPSKGGSQQRYFNPENATTAGSAAYLLNILGLGMPKQAGEMGAGLWSALHGKGYNKGAKGFDASYWAALGFGDSPNTQEDFHKAEINKINALQGRVEAGTDKAGILEGLAKGWKSFSPEVKARELEVLSKAGRTTKETLDKLGSGDASGLLAEAKAAREDSEKAKSEETRRVAANIRERERDLKSEPDAQKKLALEGQITELKKQQTKLFQDDVESAQDEEKSLYAVTRALAEQKEKASAIADIFKGIGLNEYQEKLLSLQYQINSAEAQASDLAGKDPAAADAVDKRVAAMKSELEAAKQVANLDLARRNAGIATQFAGAEVESHGVGLSEGEKLLERRKFIAQEMAKLSDLSKDSANDLLRYEVLLNASRQTGLSISMRILEVDKERKQTVIDTQREFQKSLIGAGPGELLRKLAESQLAGRNGNRIHSAGQFFSLTGESQRDVYELMGGERMASLNAEARALRGNGQNVAGAQSTSDKITAQIGKVAEEYARRILGGGGNATVSTSVATQATKAIADLTPQVVRATAAVASFADKLMMVSAQGSRTNSPPAAPSAAPVSQGAYEPAGYPPPVYDSRGYSQYGFDRQGNPFP